MNNNTENLNVETQYSKFGTESFEYLNQKTGIIFCLIGANNNYITNNINETYNILIEADKLTYSVLETINHHIEKSNGKDFKIRW